jgi:hypothetical protein
MKKLVKAIRKFILRKRYNAAKIRLMKLEAETDRLYKMVLEAIHKSEDNKKVLDLRVLREKAWNRRFEAIEKKYELEGKLRRA